MEERREAKGVTFSETLKGIERSLNEDNQILKKESERSATEREENEDKKLLKLLEPSSIEFKEIISDVMRRRRKWAKKENNMG